MKCNCKSELEAQLAETFNERHPDKAPYSAELQGYGLAHNGNELQLVGCMPVQLTPTSPTGKRPKTLKSRMVFTYCPFCGVKA